MTTEREIQVKQLFRDIPKYIDGSLPDTYSYNRLFWSTFAHELFSRIHEAYRVKSEGGADSLGNIFKPLSPSTVAGRPIGYGNLSKEGLTRRQSGTAFKDRRRGLLSPSEDAKWRGVFAKTLAKLSLKMDEESAKQQAAQTAWNVLKKDGALTRKEELGDRNVLIMRVTDTIYNSLEPNSAGNHTYRPKPNQIFEVNGSTATIGTSVEYAGYHDSTRPVIPDDIDPWVDEATDIAMDAVIEKAARDAQEIANS